MGNTPTKPDPDDDATMRSASSIPRRNKRSPRKFRKYRDFQEWNPLKQNGTSPPQLFAIMRLGHEVIRGALGDIRLHLEDGDLHAASSLWRELHQWMVMHQEMEEGSGPMSARGFFWVLDEYGSSHMSSTKLSDAHDHLDDIEDELNRKFKMKQCQPISDISACFKKYEQEALDHMRLEEQIMMPQIMTIQRKHGFDLQRIMVEEVMPCIRNEKHFLIFAIQTLEKHRHEKPRARVFAHAMWGVSTEFQWKRRLHFIENCASPELFNEIVLQCK